MAWGLDLGYEHYLDALHQDNVSASSYVNGDGSALSDTAITPTAPQIRAMLEMKFRACRPPWLPAFRYHRCQYTMID